MLTATELGLKVGDKALLCPGSLMDMVDILGKAAREDVPLTPGQRERAKMLASADLVEIVGLNVPQLPPHPTPTGTEVKYLSIGQGNRDYKVGDTQVVWSGYGSWIPENWLP